MSSSGKLVLFFAAATVFNIGLMLVFMVIVLVLTALIRLDPASPVRPIIMMVGFLASIVGTFLLYGVVMKKITVKWNLEKHIPQLFRKKR
jgi:hypothetical protein